jgi:poly(3-hydroxybutyrate) depolymerase
VAEPAPGAPVSAVIMSLHGTRSTAVRQASLSGFAQLAGTARAVVVFPQAVKPIGAGYEWDPARMSTTLPGSSPSSEAGLGRLVIA